MEDIEFLLDILTDQVTPALGCTEPVSVALAVAKAAETLDGEITKIQIKVDRNIFKNAMGVIIPGTNKKGLYMAVAIAIVGGKSEYELQVLKDINDDDVRKAQELVASNIIDICIDTDVDGPYVNVTAWSTENKVRVVIKEKHNNIVLIEKNDVTIYKSENTLGRKNLMAKDIKQFSINDLKNFADNVDIKKLGIVLEGIKMNKKIANAGMDNQFDAFLFNGKNIEEVDWKDYAKILTYSACYARMSGYSLPVMSCTGSGNHGLAAILPVVAVGEKKQKNAEKIIRAVTLSLLVTIYIKSHTGILTPVCGCCVAASVGATAGISYILGGQIGQIEGAIKNMIGSLAGVFCDGGKPGCAFKLSISVEAAIDAALMSVNGIVISSSDGIVDETAEDTIKNLAEISTKGMCNIDEVILQIMMKKSQAF